MVLDNLVEQIPVFVLSGLRLVGVFTVAPVFGSRTLPPQLRVYMTLLLAVLFLPVTSQTSVPTHVGAFLWIGANEFAIGLFMGYIVTLVLAAATYAGRLAGAHIGYGLANVVDPLTQDQATLLDQLNGYLTLLLFLALGGHRTLLHALGTSFTFAPVGGSALHGGLFEGLMSVFTGVIVLGVQIAIPVLASVFLTEAAIGLVSRGVPQLNIFSVGLGLRIIVGSIAFFLAMPLMFFLMRGVVEEIPGQLHGLLVQLSP